MSAVITNIRPRTPQSQGHICIGHHCTIIRIDRVESGSIQIQVFALDTPDDEVGNLLLLSVVPRSECGLYRAPSVIVHTLQIGTVMLPLQDDETADRVEAFLDGGDE
ncbi:MAG: hypothetical protein R3F10_03460 [Lysobacteraceae bacterium]